LGLEPAIDLASILLRRRGDRPTHPIWHRAGSSCGASIWQRSSASALARPRRTCAVSSTLPFCPPVPGTHYRIWGDSRRRDRALSARAGTLAVLEWAGREAVICPSLRTAG